MVGMATIGLIGLALALALGGVERRLLPGQARLDAQRL